MNLYDAYMTSRDRAEAPPEVQEVLAAMPTVPPRPMPPAACGAYPSLAMVYAPVQCFRMTYDPAEALARGTLFRELDKPFEAGGGRR